MFTLRAAVMWTVNDFPAYVMVSGWSTKGYMTCPVCKEDVTSGWHAGKVCYLGHRRWLPWDHEWWEKDKEFDRNTERHLRPREWSGDEILEELNRLDFAPFGKTKNVFDTLVGTILDIEGKTKDTIKARLDLERMGIRRGLWMNRDSDKARRDLAFFSMKPNDKKEFLKFESFVKFPDGYALNIARCVNVDGGKFTGLKSHDCHVFMQRLLPVGIRHLLPEDVVKPIMLLSRFFSQLTAKTLRKIDIFQLRYDIVQVLCKFEMIFPPAFFTKEALLAGPVNYRWMYPIERLLRELKKSVRNRAKPEGSIIEAWVQYESLTFRGITAFYKIINMHAKTRQVKRLPELRICLNGRFRCGLDWTRLELWLLLLERDRSGYSRWSDQLGIALRELFCLNRALPEFSGVFTFVKIQTLLVLAFAEPNL
ncbi:hypothetical protein L3X38_027866 [Prunus dulcis]|uniref:DUF4218 domain-containing protein n=1 Tax=Prunus dulcis TaxID=3755 RepID=A0AAD4VNS3_PRUDU|nr:hypothetical protein L3X38_027866 [Prunus dulcis]